MNIDNLEKWSMTFKGFDKECARNIINGDLAKGDVLEFGLKLCVKKGLESDTVCHKTISLGSDDKKHLDVYYWNWLDETEINYYISENTICKKDIVAYAEYMYANVNWDVDWYSVLEDSCRDKGKERRRIKMTEEFLDTITCQVENAFSLSKLATFRKKYKHCDISDAGIVVDGLFKKENGKVGDCYYYKGKKVEVVNSLFEDESLSTWAKLVSEGSSVLRDCNIKLYFVDSFDNFSMKYRYADWMLYKVDGIEGCCELSLWYTYNTDTDEVEVNGVLSGSYFKVEDFEKVAENLSKNISDKVDWVEKLYISENYEQTGGCGWFCSKYFEDMFCEKLLQLAYKYNCDYSFVR